jgi:hypothetical protein
MGKKVVRSSRPHGVEEKRGLLTAKLKNLIMILLARVKAQKNQTSFKEVLSGIITRKKEEIQHQRKLKLMQGSSAGGMDDQLQKVERGLTQDQTEILNEMLNKVKDKYNSNNL